MKLIKVEMDKNGNYVGTFTSQKREPAWNKEKIPQFLKEFGITILLNGWEGSGKAYHGEERQWYDVHIQRKKIGRVQSRNDMIYFFTDKFISENSPDTVSDNLKLEGLFISW